MATRTVRETVSQKRTSELREAVQCEILSFSVSTDFDSSTSILLVKCSSPRRDL